VQKCTSLLNASSGCSTSLMFNWWNGEMPVVVMVTPAGPAQQGHLWKLYEWRNWFWITSESLGSSLIYITFDNNEEVNMTMNCLQMQQPNFCCYGISKLMPRCEDVINILAICVKIMILKWNKWAAFNIVRTFCFIFII